MIPLFFDISSGELLIIILALFVVFGPRQIPEIARKVGKGVNEIKRVSNDIKDEIKAGIDTNIKEDIEEKINNPHPENKNQKEQNKNE